MSEFAISIEEYSLIWIGFHECFFRKTLHNLLSFRIELFYLFEEFIASVLTREEPTKRCERCIHAPACIDARSDLKTYDISISVCSFFWLQEFPQTCWFWILHLTKSKGSDHPILVNERHAVSDSSEGSKVDISHERRVAILAFHLDKDPMNKLECHSRTRKSRERVERVFSLGIEYGNDFFWDDLRYSVMVSDNNIDTERLRMPDRFDIPSSAVNCDDERNLLFREFIEEIWLESVPILGSMRKSVWDGTPDLSEELHEKGCRWYSIDIIISEYHNSLLFLPSYENTSDSIAHIWHEERVVEIRKSRREKSSLIVGSDRSILSHDVCDISHFIREDMHLCPVYGLHVFWL